MIEVNHLVKDYGNHHAVRDISFNVKEGQIVGLLGPNGAGKSTTMNILTGYISATSGTVRIGGYDILTQPLLAKQQIGYLPEIPPLYEDMTVDEYLLFVCELKGIRKKKEKAAAVEEVEEAVKIHDVKGRLIRNLSKGYKQRVGLAQALIGNPPLLILDEPTVGLDPNQIIEIRSLIKSLAGKHTIILSSHILSEVNAICDYVLIIDKGSLVAEDTPEALSGHFSEQKHILLSVKGEREAVEETLSGLSVIDSYEIKGEEEGVINVFAKTNAEEDIRDMLFFAFAEKKLPVIHMETEKLSLEDVFMKLTGQDVEEIEEEAKKASGKIEKQSRSFFRKRKKEEKKEEEEEQKEEETL